MLPLVVALLVSGCEKEGPSATKQLEAQAQEDARKKQAAQEAEARRKKELDDLIPKLMEARRPVDEIYGRVWAVLPDIKTFTRKECPDKQILADTPDAAGRSVLLLNKESVYLLSGRADAREGKMDTYHTPAVDHALSLRRAGGKETPLLDRLAGDSAEKVQAQIDAAAYVQKFRYVGVGMFTAYLPADLKAAPRPKPARVEGWLLVVDTKNNRPLCQVESSGEGLVHDGTINTDSAADEEAWAMFVHTSSKNIEAISKVLTVEGGATKKR